MKKFMIGLIALHTFQFCTSELSEIDGVVGDHIDSGIDQNYDRFDVPAESFLGQYFASGNSTVPISNIIENRIRHDFNSPVENNVNAKDLSAKWTGDFYFETGEYNFAVHSDKGIILTIDEQIVLDESNNTEENDYQIHHQMDGVHRIVVEYNVDEGSNATSSGEDSETSENNSDVTPSDSEQNESSNNSGSVEDIPIQGSDTGATNDQTNDSGDVSSDTPVNPDTSGTDSTPSDPVVEVGNDTPTVEVDWQESEKIPEQFPAMDESALLDPMGWAANTIGGKGGEIIKVTNLSKDGAGSLRAAIEYSKPRIIVFEVGGIIDLEGEPIKMGSPFATIMGQTAPDPGITIIKGGFYIYTHDVIVQHLRIRPGENNQAKESGWEVDALNVTSGYNVIVDHCSFSWGTDENISASGPRFEGSNLSEWRKNTSHTITFSNNIIAECLNNSTHDKGSHSMGTLFHDNVTEIALIGNMYASNADRNPLFKGGTTGVIVNNYIYNAKNFALQYKISSIEWQDKDKVTGLLSIVGNVVEKGPDSRADLPFAYFGKGPVDVYWNDNAVEGSAIQEARILLGEPTIVDTPPMWPELIKVMPSKDVKDNLLNNAGARPWARDEVDIRLVNEIREGKNRIINGEDEVGGYPNTPSTFRSFDPSLWGLD